MKNKKRIIIIVCISVILLLSIGFTLGVVFLWPGVYVNNPNLTWEENAEVKKLVLAAIEDRCSELSDVDTLGIYDITASELDIIQYNEDAAVKNKSWVCFVNPFFMKTAKETDGDNYQVRVKVFYPESCYYEFTIHRNDGGKYTITSFLLDI